MPFQVSQKTLERLEWPQLLERLARHSRTLRGHARLLETAEAPFEADPAAVATRLALTSEARAILDTGELPPLETTMPIDALLARLRRGGSLSGQELLGVGAAARTCDDTRHFLDRRSEAAPRLAGLAAGLADLRPLVSAVEDTLESDASVRDTASAALATARRDARELAGRVQERIGRFLQDRNVADALQDSYVTLRADRYVLPVRADARSRVPGIVHDASASGTTLFIEPQAVVELNNRLKQAELHIDRETQRVLTSLSESTRDRVEDLDASLELLGEIDLAFARGGLSREMEAVPPVLDENGCFQLRQLRHPLLPRTEVVPNDVHLGEHFHVLVVSGPNAGGKTVAMKALALMALFARAGLHVPAEPGARVALVDRVLADIGDDQDLRESLSTFSAHMASLAAIVRAADPQSLVVLDEIGAGTDPGEGAALAQSVLEALADAGARVVVTTHFNLLKEMADVDERFANASVAFDATTLAPTYQLRFGTAGSSSATSVAARMGMPEAVIERAVALLDSEDRRLDRMLSELSASRTSLEREREEALRLRAESESARDEYRARLERLQARRDQLFEAMRADLDRAFQEAHGEVAGVIRTLQRQGTAQQAAQARARLLTLQEQAKSAEAREHARCPQPPPRTPVDWARAHPGDPVCLASGAAGTLLALPDRRGRVLIQAGSARMRVAAGDLSPGPAPGARPAGRPLPTGSTGTPGGSTRVDLRGERVEAALILLDHALDEAARRGNEVLEIVHGVGSGALQSAVRRHLADVAWLERVEAGEPERSGMTRAWLPV